MIYYIAAAYLLCAYCMYNAMPGCTTRLEEFLLALAWPLLIITKLFDLLLRA